MKKNLMKRASCNLHNRDMKPPIHSHSKAMNKAWGFMAGVPGFSKYNQMEPSS